MAPPWCDREASCPSLVTSYAKRCEATLKLVPHSVAAAAALLLTAVAARLVLGRGSLEIWSPDGEQQLYVPLVSPTDQSLLTEVEHICAERP